MMQKRDWVSITEGMYRHTARDDYIWGLHLGTTSSNGMCESRLGSTSGLYTASKTTASTKSSMHHISSKYVLQQPFSQLQHLPQPYTFLVTYPSLPSHVPYILPGHIAPAAPTPMVCMWLSTSAGSAAAPIRDSGTISSPRVAPPPRPLPSPASSTAAALYHLTPRACSPRVSYPRADSPIGG